LAAASQGEHTFAHVTALSVEQIRHVLTEEACRGATSSPTQVANYELGDIRRYGATAIAL
jgi:hypothetical protein